MKPMAESGLICGQCYRSGETWRAQRERLIAEAEKCSLV